MTFPCDQCVDAAEQLQLENVRLREELQEVIKERDRLLTELLASEALRFEMTAAEEHG